MQKISLGQCSVQIKFWDEPQCASTRFAQQKPDANESVSLWNPIENTDLQVTYQPEGVSLRFGTQPEANAFRLI